MMEKCTEAEYQRLNALEWKYPDVISLVLDFKFDFKEITAPPGCAIGIAADGDDCAVFRYYSAGPVPTFRLPPIVEIVRECMILHPGYTVFVFVKDARKRTKG